MTSNSPRNPGDWAGKVYPKMSEYISATCDRSGQASNECVSTTWFAAKEEELELKDTPGGWGSYGFGGARKKYSGLMVFKVNVCLPTIKDEIRKSNIRRIVLVVSLALAVTLSILLPSYVSNVIITIISLSAFVLCVALIRAIFVVFWLRVKGFRARHLDVVALSTLSTGMEKKIAWRVSKWLAWKKAKQAGLDTVWSSGRFAELDIQQEDKWLWATTD